MTSFSETMTESITIRNLKLGMSMKKFSNKYDILYIVKKPLKNANQW